MWMSSGCDLWVWGFHSWVSLCKGERVFSASDQRLHPNIPPCPHLLLGALNLLSVGCCLPHPKLSQGRISVVLGFLVDAFLPFSFICFSLDLR